MKVILTIGWALGIAITFAVSIMAMKMSPYMF